MNAMGKNPPAKAWPAETTLVPDAACATAVVARASKPRRPRRPFVRLTCAIAVLALAFALGAGAAWAVFSSVSASAQNTLSAGTVQCQVDDQFDGLAKSAIAVENTGTATSYVRVRLVTYWVDEDGQPVGEPAPELGVVAADGWVQGRDGCYYAQSPVAPGAATPNLLAAPMTLAQKGAYRQVVEVLAESIQAQPADAAAEAWGVNIVDGACVPQA